MAGGDFPEQDKPPAGLTAEQAARAADLGLGLAASRFTGDVAAAIASAERAHASLSEQVASMDALAKLQDPGDDG